MQSYVEISQRLDDVEQSIKKLIESEDFEACVKLVNERQQVLVALDAEYLKLTQDNASDALFQQHKAKLEAIQKSDQQIIQQLEKQSSRLAVDRSQHLNAKRAVNLYKKTLSSY